MRDRMERFTAFPFSVGCISHSSVKVVTKQSKKPRAESSSALTIQSNGKAKSSVRRLLPLRKPNISAGIQKAIKSFKSLSSLFRFYNEDEDDDEEREMEIGFPTDVQHVGHIGCDGFNSGSAAAMKDWDRGPDHVLSHPSISLKQFELAMASQT
ncbi:CRIB domain-containing protein RIC4-like [Iris pallida]|uniref:CRIB domain-containing protein RIC4-like n=1 Tax=Iris pallida TaxID=29817 RepID=A0AAX6GGN7_IRIPA|nr:CRIB domain-containing protein RIC4-like [Iris pallida]